MIDVKRNRVILLRKLEITDLQYCEFVEEGGYSWLKHYFSHVPEMVEIARYSAMFWKWWVNEWNIRDEYFLYQNRFQEWTTETLVEAYSYTHNMDDVLAVPNKWVIKEVNKLIKAYDAQNI